jgi:MFS family permease
MPDFKKAIRSLPPTVLLLGLVSFLNDASSEMIYPLLPVFLSTVLGVGAMALGTIEGIAEFVASFLKLFSGMWADRLPRRKPLVVAGYGVSGLMRPLIGLAMNWPAVLVFRIIDRAGKGIRTSPRDALIADVTDENSRGMSYGIHRGMDHAGAVVGPLAAAGLLALGLSLRHIFFLAVIPAILVVVILVMFIREKAVGRTCVRPRHIYSNWGSFGPGFHRFILALFVFTLGNSTDAFLLMKLSNAGVTTEWIALLWAIHHTIKMGSSWVGGWMSDFLGRRRLLITGWFYYALIYVSFAFVSSPHWAIALFLLYGVYYGLTEPSEKAWVADLAPEKLRGEAFGWYNGAIGIAALPASIVFGAVWTYVSPHAAFIMGAALAFVAAVILLSVPTKRAG